MDVRKAFFIRLFALLGIFAAPMDILFILTIGALRSNYNLLASYASLLGVPGTPYSKIISVWWFIYGIMLVLFAVGLFRSMPRNSRVWWIGPILIAVFGIFDGIGSAIFPCDPGCVGKTLSGRMHLLVSTVGTAALVPIPLFCWLGLRREQRWKSIRMFSWIVQIVALIVMVGLLFAKIKGVADNLNNFGGLLQRLVYTVYYIWLVPVGVKLFNLSRSDTDL
jgi:hypothetical protein